MCQGYRIGQHGVSPTRIHLTRILLLAKRRCSSVPGGGTERSRIRYQFHVVDVSTTFPAVSVTSSEMSGTISLNPQKIFGIGNRVHIGTPVVDHQIFEVLEEPFVWYEGLVLGETTYLHSGL